MKMVIAIAFVALVGALVFGLRRSKTTDEPPPGFVKVYDFQTKKILTIPAAELAPGMIRLKLQTGEIVWAKASECKTGPLRHPPLEGEVRDLVIRIQKTLEEVYPHDYAFWEDGFRRDTNPSQEIAIWLHISRIYEGFVTNRPTNLGERKDAFRTLVACSTGTKETALQAVHLSSLSREDASVLVNKFFPDRVN